MIKLDIVAILDKIINMNQRLSNRGNILFLILLAVVLFAALSYAVTSSMRGGGSDASRESTSLKTSQLINIATNIETQLQRFLMINNYSYDFIDYLGDNLSGYDLSCASNNCNLFHPAGGGVIIANLPIDDYSDPTHSHSSSYPAHELNGAIKWTINKQKVSNVGTDLPDIILVIRGVKRDICEEINSEFNTGNNAGGVYHAINRADNLYDSDPGNYSMTVPNNAKTWCLIQGGIFGSYFHHVILER